MAWGEMFSRFRKTQGKFFFIGFRSADISSTWLGDSFIPSSVLITKKCSVTR